MPEQGQDLDEIFKQAHVSSRYSTDAGAITSGCGPVGRVLDEAQQQVTLSPAARVAAARARSPASGSYRCP
jgi:hypothetical protein